MKNRQWRVKAHPRPEEIIGPEHFYLVESTVPDIGPNELLVRTLVLGTSPAQRGYIDPRKPDIVPLGEVMRGRGIGVVEVSKHPDFQPGDWVSGSLGWQEWSVQSMNRGPVQSMDVMSVQKVDATLKPSHLHLGSLGSAAFTALYGLEDIGGISAGKTVLISAAAGGVGCMACQIAGILGCRVIGIAGGPDKCRWLREQLNCDVAIDYKNEDVAETLDRNCPDGIDLFYDNVGGELLDTVLQRIAPAARIVICGYISIDYLPKRPPGPRHYPMLLRQRARMEGFVIWDHLARYPEFFKRLKNWYDDGLLQTVEDINMGIESTPDSLRSLFTGGNTGIRLTRVSADPD